jgi:cytosine/adenosine deaminase-related metal-dependent hydrolase
MDENDRVLDDGGVAVHGGRIEAVDTSEALRRRFQANEVIDAVGQVVMPGLIDTYGHAGHGLIRGLFHPDSGWPSGELYWHHTSEEWWYAEALLAATERLRFGVTTGFSVIGATPARVDSPIFTAQNAEAYARVGVRGVFGVGPPDLLFSHLPEPWSGSFLQGGRWVERTFSYREAVENSISLIQEWHGAANGRIRIALAPPYLFGRHVAHGRHSYPLPTADDAPAIWANAKEMSALAREHGVILHTHMFKGSVRYALEHFGAQAVEDLLGPEVVVAHANGLLEAEVDMLGSQRCSVATVAYTHENLWYGYAPVLELLQAGANVTISTDGAAPYTSLDLLRELSRAIWNQWNQYHDQRVLPPGRALRMITIDAARALGLAEELGSLEPGKRADIVTVNFRQPHLTPPTSIPRLLAHYAAGQDVANVMVDGKVLMRAGVMLSVDPREVLERAREEAQLALERIDATRYTDLSRSFWREARNED